MAEPGFDDAEAFCSYSFLHLGEVGLAGRPFAVAAGPSEVWFSSQPLGEVFDVGYLEELSEHEGAEVPFGVVLYGSSWAVLV